MTRKKKKGKLVTFGISLIVVCFSLAMYGQIKESKEELHKLEREEAKLLEQQDDVQEEAAALEERRIYVQTKKYVEEVAKQIGFVYPDEIIYRPKQD